MSVELCNKNTLVSSEPHLEWTVDFTLPTYQQRLAQRGRKTDPLAKAVGLSKESDLRILDMTAGLGKDAYWLAHCGAHVTLLERHPLLAQCLQHAVQQLAQHETFADVGARMRVVQADALDYLNMLDNNQFDVAYYDPMFPERKKSALVKKDMQILQLLHACDETSTNVIETVLNKIPKLVVKRPAHAPLLEEEKPHHQINNDKIRFDVYQ